MVPEKYQFVFKFNPIYYFVSNFHFPLYFHTVPSTWNVVASVLLALVSVVVGLAVFLKYEAALALRN